MLLTLTTSVQNPNSSVFARRAKRRSGLLASLLIALAGTSAEAQISSTWNVTGNSTWGTGPWSNGAPGATTGTTNGDTAVFNTPQTTGTVTVDTGRNIGNITFDTNAGSYTLTGGSLLLSNTGTLQLASTVTSTGKTESIITPITLEGAYTFGNYSTTTDVLSFTGAIAGAASTTATLILDGTNTGANSITGGIANGSGGVTTVVKNGTGNWTLTNNSTYSGGTQINAGSLTLSSGATGLGSGTVTLGASSGSANATFNDNIGGAGVFANNIVLGGSTGTDTIAFTNTSGNPTNVSSTITGTGNLTMNNNLGFGTGNYVAWNGLVNNVGTVTFAGLGTTTGVYAINLNGGIGSNVTGLTDNSTNNYMVIGSGIAVNSGGTTITANHSSTNGSFDINAPFSGTGNLTFIENSSDTLTSGDYGILTTTFGSINNTGTFTYGGTGSNGTQINVAFGANVQGIIANNSGGSVLQLTANSSSYTHGLTIDQGTVNVSSANGFGTGTLTLGAASGSLNDTLIISATGTQTFNNAIVLGGATGTNTINTTAATNFGGAMSGNGNLTINNSSSSVDSFSAGVNFTGTLTNTSTGTVTSGVTISGIIGTNVTGVVQNSTLSTLTLSGANTYTGGTTISAGTLKIGNATALGGSAGAVSETSGAVLDLNGTTMTNTNALTLNGTGISSGGALINSSASASTYAGLLTLGSSSSITATSGNITLSNTGTITGSGDNLTLSGGSATSNSIASSISTGTGSVTASGGTWTLSGANTYAGGTTISAGTLKIGNATALGSSAGAVSETSGAVVDLNGTTMTSTNALTLNGTGISSGGALINSSSTAGTYAGLITLGSASSITSGSTTTGNITLSNTGTITGSGDNLTLGGSGTASSVASVIGTGAGTLTKNGTGTWTLSGANTFSGGTTFNAGGLVIGNASALGTGGLAFGTSSTGTLSLNGISISLPDLTTSATPGTPVIQDNNSTAAALTVNTANNDTYAGVLQNGASGTLSLVKSGAGTLALSGANTYTGGTTLSAGTLKLGSTTALGGSAGAVSETGGAVLDLNGITLATSNALTLNGTGISSGGALINSSATAATYAGLITLGSSSSVVATSGSIVLSNTGTITGSGDNLTLDGAGTASSLASIIGTGAGTLTKNGTGAWTVSGVNTYTGGTQINAGTLSVATSTSALGSGTVTLGASSGSANATLNDTLSTGTFTNAITLGASTGTLAIAFTNGSAISSNITGTNNLTINNNSANAQVFFTGLVNNSGAITFSGVGTTTPSFFFNGGIGSNVTALTDNSATNIIELTGGLTVNSGGTTLTANHNGQLGSFYITTAIGGTGNLTINENSTDAITGSSPTFGWGIWSTSAATINNTGTVTYGGSGSLGTVLFGAFGSNVQGIVANNSGTSTFLLNGTSNSYTNGLTILQGNVSIGAANAFGTGTLTLGASSGSLNDTISFGIGGGNTANNSIVLGGATGTNKIITTSAETFGGGISGTGNLTVNNTSGSTDNFTGNVNFSGNLININTGTTTGAVTLSGGVGSNVTSLQEQSAYSALTSSGTLTVNSGGTTLANTGGAVLTQSGAVTGTGNFIMSNSTSLASALVLSSTSINNAGTVTINNAGTGTMTIAGLIGTNVTGLVDNSANVTMYLTNAASTYTGSTTITAGILNVATFANGGTASSIGAATGASNLVLNGGTLQYTGSSAASTNRSFTLAASSTIDSSGSGVFADSGSLVNSNSTGTQTLTLTGSNSGANTISGSIANGSGTSVTAITKTGVGKWFLAGADTNTGAIAVNGGTLQLVLAGNTSPTSVASGAELAVNAGGTGQYTATNITSLLGSATFASGSTFGIDSSSATATSAAINGFTYGNSFTYSPAITLSGVTVAKEDNLNSAANNTLILSGNETLGTGGITAQGVATSSFSSSSTLVLAGSNSYTGATNVNGATLVLANANALGSGANTTSALNFTNYAGLANGLASGTEVINAPVSFNSYLNLGDGNANSGNFTFNSSITGSTSTTNRINTNTSGLTATITLNGPVYISSAGTSSTLNITSGEAATFIINGAISNESTNSSSTNGNLNLGAGQSGVIKLLGANTYTGTTNIEAGFVYVTTFNSIDPGSGLAINTSSSLGAPSSGAAAGINLGGENYGTTTLIDTGTGETTDRYLNIYASSALENDGTGALVFNNLYGPNVDGQGLRAVTFTLQGSNTGRNNLQGGVDDQYNSSVQGFSPGATPALSLTKSGAGFWILSGDDMYSGATSVTAGTLEFQNESALYNATSSYWTAANLTVASGATLAYGVGDGEFTSSDIATLSALGTATTGFKSGSILGLDTTDASSGNFTYSNVIANPNSGANVLGLAKIGTNTLTLNGVNTYTGATSVTGGTLAVGDGTSGSINSSSGVSVSSGATLAIDQATGTFTPAVVNNGAVVGAEGSGITNTISGGISGTGGTFTQSGAGTTILANTNSYTGATTVAAGTLQLTGSTASTSAVTVGNNTAVATLSGTGTVNGSLTLSTTGSNIANLAPGANTSGNFGSTGTLTVKGALSIGTGSALDFDLSSSTSGANDFITMTSGGGTLTIGSSLTFNINATGGSLATSVNSGATGFYTIIGGAGALSGTALTSVTPTFTITGATGYTGHLVTSGSGNNLEIYFTSVPTVTGTSYTVVTTPGTTVLHEGETTTLTTTITNTGASGTDTLDYSNLGATSSISNTLTPSGTSGTNLANQGVGTASNGQTYTAANVGSDTVTNTGTSGTNHTPGTTPAAVDAGNTGASVTVYSGKMIWSGSSGGTYGNNASWNDSMDPNLATSPTVHVAPGLDGGYQSSDTVTFSGGGGSVDLVNLSPSLNSVTFSSSGYNLTSTGTGTLQLNGGGSNALVAVTTGTDTISAPISLTTSANVAVNTGQQLTISGAISGSGKGLAFTGAGKTLLMNDNGYTGGTTVSAGTVYANNTGGATYTPPTASSRTVTATDSAGSATGTGAVTVNSGGTLAGSGTVAGASVTVNAGGTLASGGIQSGTTAGAGLTINNTAVSILGATSGSHTTANTANLTFDLGAGGSSSATQANPNTNSTYLSLAGSTSINFVGHTSITLVDLTNGGLAALRLNSPYLLISAASNAAYTGLVTVDTSGVESLDGNGYVLGVYVSGSNGSYVYDPISFNELGADGVTPLTSIGSGPTGVYYVDPQLVLYNGDLEVVPEPGTWALMIGGLALLIVIQRRKHNRG